MLKRFCLLILPAAILATNLPAQDLIGAAANAAAEARAERLREQREAEERAREADPMAKYAPTKAPPVAKTPPPGPNRSAPADPTQQTPDLLADRDPLVDQLDERALRGGKYLAEAVGSFARIGRWDKVQQWLVRINGVNDPKVLAQMANEIGPAILLKISMRSELGDREKDAIKKLSKAAKANSQDQPAIDAAIANLPEDLRSAVTLREFDGLSYEDIADIMDCPVGTVRSRIFRAREAIDVQVKEQLDGVA